jgi:2-polyprenyl-6-methoxyphenol hydroxylase-like FAD-dependent oxidoreductase
VRLTGGEEISSRLVVIANGLNLALRESMGMGRDVISSQHSITIGFDIRPVDGATFPFQALTYFSGHVEEQAAFLTLFPVPGAIRANYLVYRDIKDPWFALLRKNPKEAMLAAIPELEDVIGWFEVTSHVWVRPADLYQTTGLELPGVVVVGDAFATSCPAAGTGSGKIYVDVERLCNRYIPHWLATTGMSAAKVAQFYADPEKRAYDRFSLSAALKLKSTSVDPGLYWRLRRWAKFAVRSLEGRMMRRMPKSYQASAHVVASP